MPTLPLAYPVRNLLARRASTALTMGGISLVVFTFVAVLAMADGIRATFTQAGSDRNVLLLRHGATSETASAVGRDLMMPVRTLPGIAHAPDGRELVSPEIVVQVLMRRPDGHRVNIALRGITPMAFQVRDGIRLANGRYPRPGTNDVLVGEALGRNFRSMSEGSSFRIGRLNVTVCGVMRASGSSLESEIWIDLDRLVVEYRRDTYSTLLVRLTDPGQVPAFATRVSADARVKLQAVSEVEYYAGLETGAEEVRWLGLLMAFFMACGAVFGAMNTMYQAVAGRTRELATLRALGFSRASVLASVLLEALVLCACGGLLGCLLVMPLSGWEMRAVNVKSLTEVGYRMEIGQRLLVQGFLLSVFLGVAGGLLPAWQATRVRVVDALRQV